MKQYHAFISYASEDKDLFVLPLANQLREMGLNIWIDEFCLKVGDSIREKIDLGLSNSDYGIVILSGNFFNKNWPQKELNGLYNLEMAGQGRILPIWNNITKEEVLQHSPLLADKHAIIASDSVDNSMIVRKLLEVLDPDKEALAERLLLDWTKLEKAAVLFLRNRPLFGIPRNVSLSEAISIMIDEGHVTGIDSEDLINIRGIRHITLFKVNNYKEYLGPGLIRRLNELILFIEKNI